MSYLKAFFNLIETFICLVSSIVGVNIGLLAYAMNYLSRCLCDHTVADDIGFKLSLAMRNPSKESVKDFNAELITSYIQRETPCMLIINYVGEERTKQLREQILKDVAEGKSSPPPPSDSDSPE